MKEVRADLFEHLFTPGHVVGISVNGFVKKNGEGVMGRGCARSASIMFHDFPRLLGQHIRMNGNVPGYVTVGSGRIKRTFIVLPVKHNWWERADIELIKLSRTFLCGEAVHQPETAFHVPRLGCGNGKLDWDGLVKPMLEVCPNNVWVHH